MGGSDESAAATRALRPRKASPRGKQGGGPMTMRY